MLPVDVTFPENLPAPFTSSLWLELGVVVAIPILPVVSSINNLVSFPASPPTVSIIENPDPSLTLISKAKLAESLSSNLSAAAP